MISLSQRQHFEGDGSFKTIIYFAIFFHRRTKTNWVLPEKFSMFFKSGFCVPRTTFSGKKEKIEVFFGSSFLELERRLNWLLRNLFSFVVKTSIDVSRGTFLGVFLGENWKVFSNVLIFWAKRFRKGCQNCFSRLDRSFLGRKLFFIFRLWAKHSWTPSRKSFASVVKTALCVLRTAFWAKMMLLKRIYRFAFHVFRRLRKSLGCLVKQFRHVCQILTLREQSNFFRKLRFFWRGLSFWQFQDYERWFFDFGRKFSAEVLWQKNWGRIFWSAIGVPPLTFSDFASKFFYHIQFLSDVLFDFWRKICSWFVKTAFV